MIGEGNRATYLIAPLDLDAVRHRKVGRPQKPHPTTSISDSSPERIDVRELGTTRSSVTNP